LGLLGSISGYRLGTYLKKKLIDIVEDSLLPAKRACSILGLKPKRFYRWRKNYTLFGVDGLVDEKPVAKIIPNKLLNEEEQAILDYANLHPEQRHREIQFNLDQQKVTTVSFSSVYQIWLVDISFISVKNGFWYLIAVIDLYSRYIVGWDLSATMTSKDVQRVVDFALLQHGFYEREAKPKIHSDNGSQMKAKSFKAFLKDLGMFNEYSRPHVPEDQAVLERFFRTIKQGEVYQEEYENHYQARGFVTPYQKLTGQEQKIFKERKARAIVAQEIRKIANRRKINISTNEEIISVENRDKKIFI